LGIIKVTLDKIRPNPYQPKSRVEVSEEDARKFGESILAHGMILTPVGRRSNGFFEMGDGWLRLAGHRWLVDHGHLEYQNITFDERELSNQQMADLVIEANKTRKDLNPIEEAEFYSKYIKNFGGTQEELAKKYGISQGEVANTLRLLDLPENVQEKVISREITSTHARQLLRLNIDHEAQTKYMDTAIKHSWSVSQLDNEINRLLWQNSKPLNQVKDRWAKGALFDVKECWYCEKTAIVANPWGESKKTRRCMDISCWEKKQKAAEKARDTAAKKKLEKKAAGQKVLTHKDIGYGDYERIEKSHIDNPSECDKCSKRALYSHNDDGSDPHAICTDVKCYRAKKTRKTKAENKPKREQERALTVRLGEIFEKTSKNRYNCLVLAVRYMTRHIDATTRDDISHMFDNLPKYSNGKLDPDSLCVKAISMPEQELVKLLNAMVISYERRKDSWQQFSTELKEGVLLDLSILEGTYEAKAAEQKAFNEANCDGCINAKQALVHTGEPCCEHTYNRKIKDGVCQSSPHKKELQPPKEEKEAAAGFPAAASKRKNSIKSVLIPEGVRLCQDVPKEECHECNLDTQDHTINFKFPIADKAASDGVAYQKVCIKDYRAWEKKQEKVAVAK
jgi:ParB family chromosome partitioning protein